MSLEQLIKACKKNDAKAQGQIYKLFSSKLYTVCLKYSNNRVEAEDHLQDAFVTIFNKINQFNYKGSFEGWMKRVVINTVLQSYRTTNVFSIVNENLIEDTNEIEIEEDGENIVTLDFLLETIQSLPKRYRLVFNLYVLDKYSHKEIANMLKISVGTSKSNLARARIILKDKIERYTTTLLKVRQ